MGEILGKSKCEIVQAAADKTGRESSVKVSKAERHSQGLTASLARSGFQAAG
ncbi:hypothetical protein FOYG_04461 [Fusarium oxysporum NRRL 32931]|uniref:Uncharacterized protein n=1 Tax=Fusarium oxysporum NRRL 32931 TaxID=660029 RepID=W9ILC7_FUSOX|nr:hypothetical protein FOYG_04461 [Fusarium oxysporum NRRL 32931]